MSSYDDVMTDLDITNQNKKSVMFFQQAQYSKYI